MNKVGLRILIQLIETNYYSIFDEDGAEDEHCICLKCDKKWFSIQDNIENPIDTSSLI